MTQFPDSCRTIFPRYIILWPWSAHDYTFTQQCRGLRFGKGMASHASCSLCRTIALFFVILLNLKVFRWQKLEDLGHKFQPEKRRDAIAGQIDPSQVQFGQILTTVVLDKSFISRIWPLLRSHTFRYSRFRPSTLSTPADIPSLCCIHLFS